MRSRILSALVVACIATFLIAGCGDDSGNASGGNSTKELASTPGSGDSGSDTDTGSDSGSSDDTLPDIGDMSLPDMSDFDDLGDCMAAATAFGGLAAAAMGAGDAESALDQLKADLPEELSDDLQTLADGYATLREQGIIEGAEALDTPEFRTATERIAEYFEDECSGT